MRPPRVVEPEEPAVEAPAADADPEPDPGDGEAPVADPGTPEGAAPPAEETGPFPVLIAHPVASTTRLIRETLEQFTTSPVITTPDPLRAFELALQRRHALFFFAIQLGELSGPTLYELISKACTVGRGPHLLAPGVVFVRDKDDPKLPPELSRDVRVKAVLTKPIRIERILQCAAGALEIHDPTARP